MAKINFCQLHAFVYVSLLFIIDYIYLIFYQL